MEELTSARPDPVSPGECGLVGIVATDLRQGKKEQPVTRTLNRT